MNVLCIATYYELLLPFVLQPASHDINDPSGTASLKSVGLSLMLGIRIVPLLKPLVDRQMAWTDESSLAIFLPCSSSRDRCSH